MPEHAEVIVVGAGAAGNAAALTLARAGLDVLVLERSAAGDACAPQGALLLAPAIERLAPDFRTRAPLQRRIVERRTWTLDAHSHVETRAAPSIGGGGRETYSVLRAPFDEWLRRMVGEAGVRIARGVMVIDLLREGDGRVVGVLTDQGRKLFADVVVLADGIEGLVARRAGLRDETQTVDVMVTVKQLRHLSPPKIEQRFGLAAGDGMLIEASARLAPGVSGIGLVYTHREAVSLEFGCALGDIVEGGATPSDLLSRFKRHPSIRALIDGSEAGEFTAQLSPRGGYRSVPRLFGDGWLTCGDAAHLSAGATHAGPTLALASGRLAAETIAELKCHGRPMTARHLSLFRDKLEQSAALKELRRLDDPAPSRRSESFLAADPQQLARAARGLSARPGGLDRSRQRELLTGVSFGRSRG